MTKIDQNLEKLKQLKDKDIDYSDIPETNEDFWADAKLVMPKKKQPISLRVDKDVLEWFKKQGSHYQSRMNAVLRAYMEHH